MDFIIRKLIEMNYIFVLETSSELQSVGNRVIEMKYKMIFFMCMQVSNRITESLKKAMNL